MYTISNNYKHIKFQKRVMVEQKNDEIIKLVQVIKDATTEPVQNYGKGLDDVSERHRRRKVKFSSYYQLNYTVDNLYRWFSCTNLARAHYGLLTALT